MEADRVGDWLNRSCRSHSNLLHLIRQPAFRWKKDLASWIRCLSPRSQLFGFRVCLVGGIA